MKLLILLIISIITANCYAFKKGTTFGSDPNGDREKCNDIKDLKVGWYYNWDKQPTCKAGVTGVEFVPTIWGKGSLPIGTLPASEFIIGFNEPNYGNQANLSPKEAAELWSQLEATGRKLVGPGVADCGESLGGQCTYSSVGWYKQFIGNCTELYGSKGCRMDAVSLHLYYCNADDMMNKINLLYKATGKPVWLTEFACNVPKDQAQVVTFAQKLLPMLEASNITARYSWFLPFCANCQSNGLLLSSLYLDQNGNGNLSPIGEYYSDFSSSGTDYTTTSGSITSSTSSSIDNFAIRLSIISNVLLVTLLLSILLVL